MNLSTTKITRQLIRDIWRETMRGKTLDRILLNYNLREVTLGGEIIDLGSASRKGSYHRFLKYADPHNITFTDLYKGNQEQSIQKINLEEKFDLPSDKYDAVTCFNVLEHIYNYDNLIAESFRILKPGGVFVGSVPFLVNYHADPNDYWRYTWQTLEKIFLHHGFVAEKMTALCVGPFTASFSQIDFIFPKFIKPIFHMINIGLDSVLVRWKNFLVNKHVLGYLFIFKKN